MKTKNKNSHRLLFLIAGVIFFLGLLISAMLFKSTDLSKYPTMIADAYREKQHHLSLPGKTEVLLTRTGAYGIYYEYSLVSASAEHYTYLPPNIQCSLTSHDTGSMIQAVPDYVESNRYWSKEEGGLGVLVMSISIDEPGNYTFECSYNNDQTEPEIVIALGPNYYWEFLKVAWNLGLPILGSISLAGMSILVPLILIIIGFVLKRSNKREK